MLKRMPEILTVLIIFVCGFFAGKFIYDREPETPRPPETKVETKIFDIPEFSLSAKIRTVNISSPIVIGLRDTIYKETPTLVATADTSITMIDSIVFSDTSYTVRDTLKLQAKYFYPPINEFTFKVKLSVKRFTRKEFVYVEKQEESFWKRIHFGVGIGYGFPSQNFIPQIQIGAYYQIF